MARYSLASVCSVLLLANAVPVQCETPSQKIDRFVAAITEADESAAHAQENLAQMAKALRGDEWRAVREVIDAYSVLRGQLYAVPLLGTLSGSMESRADRDRVMEVFILSAQAAHSVANVSLRTMNEAMPGLTNPAVTSEAEKLRDKVQQERDLLESLGPAIER